ncbi:MAG: ATP-binding protein [Paraclostridium sp.]
MLKMMSVLLLSLSIIIRFFILKGILTHSIEAKENSKKVFLLLLLIIYIITRIDGYDEYSSNKSYIVTTIVLILWGIYYNYFYRIGYIKYTIVFCLFSAYYDLANSVLGRIVFYMNTGYIYSSKESLLVSYLDNIKVQIYVNLLILAIYLLIYAAINIFKKKIKILSQSKRNYVYLLFALIANSINLIIDYIAYKLRGYELLRGELYYFEKFVGPQLIVVSCVLLILLFRKIIVENKLEAQNELIKNKLDMQYTYYLNIQESHMKVKKLYHDINNHICCIDKLNNTKEVNEYVNNLKDEIKEFKSIYNTGNMILDIIINEKSIICIKKGIKFNCDINFSKVDFIKPIDVSSIFSNVLDNAIEACDKIDSQDIEKYIRIKGTISKSYFIIKCENSKINTLRRNKNLLLTDKKDKFVHGIGLQSIKSSIQKYKGELLFEDEKDKFILNIYIPLNQNTDSWVH